MKTHSDTHIHTHSYNYSPPSHLTFIQSHANTFMLHSQKITHTRSYSHVYSYTCTLIHMYTLIFTLIHNHIFSLKMTMQIYVLMLGHP